MPVTIHVKQGPNKWELSVELAQTVGDLKKQIAEASEIPSENQRLIYSGKILKDDQTLESYKIQEDHVIHLVKSGANKSSTPPSAASPAAGAADSTAAGAAPQNIASGQTAGFNPLNDLTGARYAGYLNMPNADMFGPDGGLTQAPPSEEEMIRMMENPIFQSQMNEMLSNPQMLDFIIQSNPQLQAMGPQAREMFQSPMLRQMLTNPEMMRQSMHMAEMMRGNGMGAPGAAAQGDFPAPGEDTNTATTENTQNDNTTQNNNNPFASLLNPAMNPYANLGAGNGANMPNFASLLEAMRPPAGSAGTTPQQQPADTRPPEERYEQQLRQLNDMGFFDFDKNVAALRRSGGSVQGAVEALLNGSV